ncbi:M48 family metallopeptidase [Patescibacteria group bacterium]|nr:M48 family metallopeptidase [Patescibacteria group bacterium]
MTHYQLVASNKRKSFLVVTFFIVFIGLVSYVMAIGFGYGLDMVGLALIMAGVFSFVSYWWSDKIILGLSKAKPASRSQYFDFYTVTENLTHSQQLPMPQLYVIEDSAMNAFATGRSPKKAVVCATTGLLSRLNRSEIEGVVAHELSHVQNYDMLLMSLVTILVGFISLLADWMLRASFGRRRSSRDSSDNQLQVVFLVVGLVLALLSPLIANLIKLAISRRREFLADASGIAMTKNPQGLVKALTKISQDTEPLEVANKATAHLYITDPLKNSKSMVGWLAGLFQTHPPVEERITALTLMSG